VPTATGDADRAVATFYRNVPARSFEPTDLGLFSRTVEDLRAFILEQDLVLVAGGNTANMLAVWRVHGLDPIFREAWEAGIVLAGGSAGANCWFESSTTDSFLLGHADALTDGLALASGSFCPHFDGEPARRPGYLGLVADGTLPPGIACDDLAAVHLVDTEVDEVVASGSSSGAYRVEAGPDCPIQEPLPVRLIGGGSA
jgi:peptidase E